MEDKLFPKIEDAQTEILQLIFELKKMKLEVDKQKAMFVN